MSETYETRVGRLDFTHDFANGYPTQDTRAALFDAMDFQRACQAYLWALPFVSMAQWKHEHEVTLGAENGKGVIFYQFVNLVNDSSLGCLWEQWCVKSGSQNRFILHRTPSYRDR